MAERAQEYGSKKEAIAETASKLADKTRRLTREEKTWTDATRLLKRSVRGSHLEAHVERKCKPVKRLKLERGEEREANAITETS